MNRLSCRCHRPIRLFCLMLITVMFIACSSVRNRGEKPGRIPETVLGLTPSADNPRNSEGDFITLKDGRILFVYSHYTAGTGGDHDPAFLAGRYSHDGGMSWTTEDVIVVENEGGMNVMSVSLLRLQNGEIALFYLMKNSTEDCIPMMRISKDEARTWSDPIPCITDRKGYFVLNNDRVVQLKDGRLLMPVALHNVPGGKWENRAALYCYHSDDNGRTWHASSQVPNSGETITQEPGVIEMKDGRIMMYIRASGGLQQLSYSSDRGETWSHIEPGNIPSPLSPATIEKVPESGDWILVWNNNDGTNPGTANKRTPLTVAISKDEGQTWERVKNIHDDPDGWYCYTAIHFVDNKHLLLSYCAGSQSRKTELAVTVNTLLPLKWIYE